MATKQEEKELVKNDPNRIVEILPTEVVSLDIPSEDRFSYILGSGLKVKLRPVELIKIKNVRDSIKIPKRPVYETRTFSGKTQTLAMDEESAKQVPGGEAIWELYTEDRRQALEEQNDRIMRALFYFGTEIGEIPDTEWEEEQGIFGVETPTHSNEKINTRLRWVQYLISECKQKDLIGLSNAIMKVSGVTEEEIQEAEDAFRG